MFSSKAKSLFKNIGFIAISNFSTKILTFLLVPLYTNVLSTTEYGTYDLVSTTVNLLIPILTVDIVDSTLRFALDQKISKRDILTVSVQFFVIGTIISALLAFANLLIGLIEPLQNYPHYFVLMFASIAGSAILAAFARGADKVKEASIVSAVGSALSILLNILFLLQFKMGLDGYFLATIIGYFVQFLLLVFVLKAWKYLSASKTMKGTKKEMVSFSMPLIVNNIAWWINNASDRYVVTYICGLWANGIYSVAYKIPTILSVVQSIFQQAWMISAVHDFDKDDKDGFFTNIYNIYNVGMVLTCAALIIFNRPLARFLYAKEFYQAWQFVPVLTLGFVFAAVSNYLGGIFQAVKDTKIITYSTLGGALLNIVSNIVLVYLIGPMGAAIATCSSYFLVWIIRIIWVRRYIKLRLDLTRDFITYGLLMTQVFLCEFTQGIICYVLQTLVISLIIMFNRKALNSIITKFFRRKLTN
jgi:Membrane protein involved in the export of O-antigen and teichoic acid